MYLVAIAWAYVVLMMAVAEATAANGTVLGAFFTLLLYGVLPLSILIYIMRTPARRRARLARENANDQQPSAATEQAATGSTPQSSP
jgi:mannose/fructose/N-acetylgalactosamine-specific phosphotransferase system component IID